MISLIPIFSFITSFSVSISNVYKLGDSASQSSTSVISICKLLSFMSPEEIMVLSGFNKVYLICGLPIVERILRSNFPFLDDTFTLGIIL